MNTEQEQEIIRIGKKLEKSTHNDLSNEEEALGLLKALQGCDMSLEVLQKSRVGLSVNKIRQKYSGSEAASVAKKLIKSWKKLLPAGQNSNSREATPKSNKSGSNSPKSSSSSGTAATANGGKPNSPPPVAYVQQQSSGSSHSSENSVEESRRNGGDFPSRRLSSTSDEIVLNFPPSVESQARTASTGSDVRDRCRDLLAKALQKGLTDVTIQEETQFYNLAAQIEQKVYGEFRDAGNKYKQRVRSRISNLGDIKNPSLRQNVISGEIDPARIAVMTTEEMASDSMKKLRQKITKEAIRDAQVSASVGTKTSLLKCSKCRKRNCTYTQAQTRSADEPMTTFCYCNDCGHRWKFC